MFFLQLNHIDQIISGLGTWVILLAICACIVVLSRGADLMIAGAIAFARLTRLPEIIIGATIISLGMTLPEVFIAGHGKPVSRIQIPTKYQTAGSSDPWCC